MGFNKILSSLIVAGSVCFASAQTAVNVTGTVLDTRNNAKIAGAVVRLAFNPAITATTDANGAFTLTGTTAINRKNTNSKSGFDISLVGTEINLSVNGNEKLVNVDLYTLNNKFVKNVFNKNLVSGEYKLNTNISNLSAGLYFVHAKIGNEMRVLKMSTLNNSANASGFVKINSKKSVAAKINVDAVDSVVIMKTGYKRKSLQLLAYTGTKTAFIDTIFPIFKLWASDRKAPSMQNWGKGDGQVDVAIFDYIDATHLTLPVSSTDKVEGKDASKINFNTGSAYSAWGAIVNGTTVGVDLSEYTNGSIQFYIKGDVPNVSVAVGSVGGLGGNADVTAYGYLPDGAWHNIVIPMSVFAADMSQVNKFFGFGTPGPTDTFAYDFTQYYILDDVLFSTGLTKVTPAP